MASGSTQSHDILTPEHPYTLTACWCRGHDQWANRLQNVLETPKVMWERTGLLQDLNRVPPGMAIDLQGMGTWRLKGLW